MNVTVNGPKIITKLFGFITITQTTLSSFIVMVLLCFTGWILGRNLKKRPGRMQVITEKLVTMLYDLVEDAMGKHNSYWAPYIGALMLSSVCGSLIGMTGFLRSSTADLMTTMTWALMTSVLSWYGNIKYGGLGPFLKNYINPLNIVSEIAQPVSMAFRHFGNIMGGGVLTSLIYAAFAVLSSAVINLIASNTIIISIVVIVCGIALLAWGLNKKKLLRKIFGIAMIVIGCVGALQYTGVIANIPILQVGIPALLSLYFDVFTGGIQALVFSLLTMVYVGMACPPPEECAHNADKVKAKALQA